MDDVDEFEAKMEDEVNSKLDKQLQDSVHKGKFEEDEEDGYSEED